MSYDVILTDPPWPYDDRRNKHGGIENHYSPMKLEEIAHLGHVVRGVLRPDAHLYMWTTHNFVHPAIEMFPAWGFRYITALPWFKLKRSTRTPVDEGWYARHLTERDLAFGSGHYFRGGNSEWLLFGVRGRKPPAVRNERSCLVAPVREHSRKPREQYGKIERVSRGPGSRALELFARSGEDRPEWFDVWGDQAGPGQLVLPGWEIL